MGPTGRLVVTLPSMAWAVGATSPYTTRAGAHPPLAPSL